MINRKPNPKIQRKIEIPYDLQDGMRELFAQIEDAANNPDGSHDGDDALQIERISGGRVGDKRRPYVFTFYPRDAPEGAFWNLYLHLTEIEDIGDSIMTDFSLYCCADSTCGFKSRNSDDLCPNCDYERNIPEGPKTDCGPPCEFCGENIRTKLAKQCLHCGADWH